MICVGIFGKLKKSSEKTESKDSADSEIIILSPADGTFVPMKKIADDVFSEGILGFCCGIEPVSGEIFSPVDGVVTQVSDTNHAIGIESDTVEILLHIGIDTVEMNGDGFEVMVSTGDNVRRGDRIMKADVGRIRDAGHPATVVTVITNSSKFDSIAPTESEKLNAGDVLLRICK